MEANKILQSDILDILFEDRNKAYGAYELRRSYNKRILTALAVTGGLLLLALAISFVVKKLEPSDTSKLDIRDVELINIKEEPPPPEPPPPPPPPRPRPSASPPAASRRGDDWYAMQKLQGSGTNLTQITWGAGWPTVSITGSP